MTLTSDPQYLDILESQMISCGQLEIGQRLLTPDDAALIQSDEELRSYLTSPAGPNGLIILKSIPKDIHGNEVVPYLRDLLSSSAALQMRT